MKPEIEQSSFQPQGNLKAFFESVPPGVATSIPNCVLRQTSGHGLPHTAYNLMLPALELYCQTASCDGPRLFQADNAIWLDKEKRSHFFVTYRCRNCKSFVKTYAFWAELKDDGKSAEIRKYGEEPAFGPPTPARVTTLLAEEKEYFFKGRQAENQGMGIAAFAYYRRVVENKKDKIIDEIIRVAQKVGAKSEAIEDLRDAKKHPQFSRAVDAIRHGIPPSLLVGGIHNPLNLLHSALSEGLHAETDEQCLALATSIRTVLIALVERLALALKDEIELNAAISRLLKSNADKTSAGS